MYCWRIKLKDVSVGVGGDASTMGRAGLTTRPPIVTDMMDAGFDIIWMVLVVVMIVLLCCL